MIALLIPRSSLALPFRFLALKPIDSKTFHPRHSISRNAPEMYLVDPRNLGIIVPLDGPSNFVLASPFGSRGSIEFSRALQTGIASRTGMSVRFWKPSHTETIFYHRKILCGRVISQCSAFSLFRPLSYGRTQKEQA